MRRSIGLPGRRRISTNVIVVAASTVSTAFSAARRTGWRQSEPSCCRASNLATIFCSAGIAAATSRCYAEGRPFSGAALLVRRGYCLGRDLGNESVAVAELLVRAGRLRRRLRHRGPAPVDAVLERVDSRAARAVPAVGVDEEDAGVRRGERVVVAPELSPQVVLG